MNKNIALISNTKAGLGGTTALLDQLINASEQEIARFTIDESQTIEELVQKIASDGFTTIIVSGGDGTLSGVISAILKLKAKIKLGIIPTGTFNHLAKDLGVPLDIEAAFEAALKGQVKMIDVGQVNGTYFINNSSLGLYPLLVKEREAYQKRGWTKKLALVASLFKVFKRHPLITISFVGGEKVTSKNTPFVFIGNNKYQFEGLNMGGRAAIDQGILSVCLTHRAGRWRMIVLILKALIGTATSEKDFDTIGLQECTITSAKKEVLVSVDGEILRMKNPLVYRIVPKALSVIIE